MTPADLAYFKFAYREKPIITGKARNLHSVLISLDVPNDSSPEDVD